VSDSPAPRPRTGWRRPAPWLLAGAILAAVALPGGLAMAHVARSAPTVGVAHPTGSNQSFAMTLTDTPAFAPRYLNATASGPLNLSIHLDNIGGLAHTFTVAAQTGVVLNRSWSPQQLDAYFVANGSLISANVSAGTSVWANFTFPASNAPRAFEFVSTIPYQFQAGMWGFLNLTPAGPTLALSDNATNNLQFVPSLLSGGPSVHGGATFDIKVTNLGDLSHTFTVSSQVNITLTSTGNFSKYAPLVNVSIPSTTGGSVWANFTVPGVGVYEFACTVPGHFAGGMYGFLYVGVAVPAPPAAPSTALVEVPVLAGSAVLLGVGLALALAVSYGGRFPKKPASPGHHA